MKYDFVILGAGLFGSVLAGEMNKTEKKCLVAGKRNHFGGNTYFEDVEGINVDKYGANNEKIWDYVNSFVEFNQYANSPMANYEGELFNLPFNMNIFYQLCKVKSAAEAKKKIKVIAIGMVKAEVNKRKCMMMFPIVVFLVPEPM